ncbi:MAG: sulfatase-like hydrolase/transferase [Candidatus Cyclobacteriaceae bacterium M3_2C_046]
MSKKIIVTQLLAISFFVWACQSEKPAPLPERPNIIFILTDDLGYGDLGVLYQNQRAASGEPCHKTPHLDSLAREGMLLTRHYTSAPVCAPARASLLLGMHQGHANVRNNQFDKALADNHTLASVLKQAGYSTGIIGKYGLQGKTGSSPKTWPAYPTRRGFDFFFGYVRHVDGHNHYPAHKAPKRPPMELYYQEEEISDQLQGCYTTDLFTAAAKKWITGQVQQKNDKPFFLYLAYDTPHAGLQIAADPYPEGGGLQGGMQWRGKPGQFINTAAASIDDYIHPDYAGQDWPDQYKRFASMVRRIDNGIGDIKWLLKDLGIDRQTLIVFSSDNGPHNVSYGYGDYQPTLFDNFGPLDGIKRDTWEGGIRVPTLVWWPGKVPVNTTNDIPSAFYDWMPTMAELAGLPAPAVSDGTSLVNHITGKPVKDTSLVYVEYEQARATPDYPEFHPSHQGQVRKQMQVIYLDGYKGVRYNIKDHQDNFRIYETSSDSHEINDLDGTSTYFDQLQQQMKDQVLRIRRPDASAPRPYDQHVVPALTKIPEISSGIAFKQYQIACSWVPDDRFIKDEPTELDVLDSFAVDKIAEPDEPALVVYSGFIQIPASGRYTFSLNVCGKAVFQVHQATLIDADKNYNSGQEMNADILLEKGLHPIKLFYRPHPSPCLQLQWRGPGISDQPLGSDHLYHLPESLY